MKKQIILLFSILTFILVNGAFISSYGQPTVKVNYSATGLLPGATITVPVTMTGTLVGSWALIFDYDDDVLTYVTSSGIAPGAGIFGVTNPTLPPYGKVIKGSYAYSNGGSGTGLTYTTDQVVFTITFIYNGGTTTFPFLNISTGGTTPTETYVKANPYTSVNLGTNYIAGSASGSYADITSLPGGGLWSAAGTWDKAHAPNNSNGNIFINSTTPVVVADPTVWPRNLTINAGKFLTTSATFSVGGTFTIEDGGSFVDNNANTLTATVERDMAGNWVPGNTLYQTHLISSPVAGQSNSIFTGSLMDKWNEAAQIWNPLTLPFITMGVGTGYNVGPTNGGITANFSGVLNTGDKTISGLTKTGAGTYSGFNLVGNPYPSAFTWNTSVLLTNVAPSAWYWNGGAYIAIQQSSPGVIGAEQGFFVLATGAGSITIPNSVRTHSTTFYKSTVNDLITLKVEGNNYWDQTQLHVNPLSTPGFEQEYDALKIMGSTDAPQLYSMLADENLSINSVPTLSGSPVIQLGFKAGSVNNFTITASDLESFESNTEFYLEDLIANKVQNLKVNPVYTFSAAPGQQEHRFNLHFSPVGIQEGTVASGIKIYSAEKTIYVNITSEMKGSVVVYNLLGSEIARTAIQPLSLNKINLSVPTGFYLVKVEGDSNATAGKVFIK